MARKKRKARKGTKKRRKKATAHKRRKKGGRKRKGHRKHPKWSPAKRAAYRREKRALITKINRM